MRITSGSGGAGLLVLLLFSAVGSVLHAVPVQIPDVIVYDVGVNGGDLSDIEYHGQDGGIAAYSIATQSCNKGTAPVLWIAGGGSSQHPVIGQNLFRLRDGRFEQIGQSWLKHGFCAVNELETSCAPCRPTDCDTLGVGCADTYWANLNGLNGRSKRFVNAATGTHTDNNIAATGHAAIRGRLQVAVADVDPGQNPGAEYFIEGQYVTADDTAAGVSANNASWRRVVVLSVAEILGGGATRREEPALYAWQEADPKVVVRPVHNHENDGAKTLFFLAYRVTKASPVRSSNLWHYEYAIQNLNSDQSAGSFSVPVHPDAIVSQIGFHDVAYHGGDPYDGTDWPGAKQGGEVRWATSAHGVNPDANALRWGTLYNWRFDANAPPGKGSVTIGLFKPGPHSSVTVEQVLVPTNPPAVGSHGRVGPTGAGGIPLAVTVARSGLQPGPGGLSQVAPAIVGGEWIARVELEGATESLLLISAVGPAQGGPTEMGELLVQPPFLLRRGTGEHTLRIPDDPDLVGVTFWTQAAVRAPTGWRLTNALDVTIGALR